MSRLCRGLARRGISVRVLTTNAGVTGFQEELLEEPIVEDGVEVIRYAVDKGKSRIFSSRLVESLPDALSGSSLIHLSAIWQPIGPPIQSAAHKANIPVLHSLRGALSPYSFRAKPWKKVPYFLLKERPLLQHARGIHVTSSQEIEEIEWLRLRAKRYWLPNPVDTSAMQPTRALREHWRKKLGYSENTRVLLVCGRMHHKKGLDHLVKILACQDLTIDWRLLLVGRDEDGSREKLIRGLEQAGLSSRISILETVPSDKLVGLYNASDLLLLPSRHENFGNVVVEALACGCTILASDQTGIASDLKSNVPGYFGDVLKLDVKTWAEWIAKWLRKPKRADESTIAWTAGTYGEDAVAEQAIKIYSAILQGK